MRKSLTLLLIVALVVVGSFSCKDSRGSSKFAAPVYELVSTPADSVLAEEILSELVKINDRSTPELMLFAAKKLLGQSYVAGTLERGDHEQLRVYLKETDCILFVETVMNLALTAKEGKAAFHDLCNNIARTRYRDAVVKNYSDRIHYTTEWIRQGEAMGIMKDVTLDVGGEVYDHPISYMSAHSGAYPHLKDAATDPVAAHDLEVITEVENKLNEVPLTYVPKDRISKIQDNIHTGDIIGFMSNIDGLDIAHVVMAYVQQDPTSPSGKKVGFIHASMGKMQVVVDSLSIADYVGAGRRLSGIKVVRMVD